MLNPEPLWHQGGFASQSEQQHLGFTSSPPLTPSHSVFTQLWQLHLSGLVFPIFHGSPFLSMLMSYALHMCQSSDPQGCRQGGSLMA